MMEQKRQEIFRDAEPAADGGTFRVVIGMIGFVVLIAVGWIAMSLHELKDDLRSLQKDETRQLVILDAEMEALKKEAGAEFQSLKEALSRVWHQHKPAELEVMGFLASLDPEQRKSLFSTLESLNGEENPGSTGSVSDPEPALVSPSKPVLVSPSRPSPGPPPDSPEPPAESPEPSVDSPEPPVDTPEPPVDTPEPPVDTPEPPVDTPEPPGDTPEPPGDTPEPPAGSPGEGSIQFKEYRIQPGDSLSRIAQKHKVSSEALARANEITEPDRIRVGQVLRIPLGAGDR